MIVMERGVRTYAELSVGDVIEEGEVMSILDEGENVVITYKDRAGALWVLVRPGGEAAT